MNGFALSQTVGVLVIGVTGGLQERAAPDSYSPATLGPSVMIGSGPVDVLRPPAISGEEICNSLDITDTQAYNYGNGNCWGGESIFGITYDLQCAQSCEFFADCCVSDCTVDSLTFGSHNASDALYLGVFEDGDGDCIPDNAATGEAVVPTTAFANFSDTIFGLIGTRATGSGDGFDICAPAGNNFVLIQPVTSPSAGGSSGDWCYVVRDDAIRGCDSVLRDGPNNSGGGGYGTSTWITAGSFCCPGANAQAVSVKCGPPVPKCIYQVRTVKIKNDICGKPSCVDCPYAPGDIICTHDCATTDDCAGSLRGTSACPRGGVCKVTASLVACDACPRGAKRCR